MPLPRRGEVWYVDFNPVRGHEQGGQRPALVISADSLNSGAAGVVVVIPITSREKRIRSHIEVAAGEAGLAKRSFIKCEDVRSVSIQRLGRRLGAVEKSTLERVEAVLRILLVL